MPNSHVPVAPLMTRLLLTALAIMTAMSAMAPGIASAEAPRVYVGVYLHDVSSFDQKNGVFDVDAEIWAKWRGDFDPDELRIANGARIDLTSMGREQDGTWQSARWRLRGTLRGEFPVQRFPFDEQTLAVILELPEHQGQLVPDLAGSGMAQNFSITDWLYEPEFRPAVSAELFRSDLGSLAAEGQPSMVHRVAFEVDLRRPIVPVTLKLFLPLFIVALVVLASLFVHPESVQPRVTMCVTGLVACFAFQFSVSDVLPEVAYLTMADTLFIIVYVISTCCVTAAVIAHSLHRREQHRAAIWSDRVLRPLLPAAALITVWVAIPEPYPEVVVEADAIPVMTRHDSTRDLLRIGTHQNLRLASAPAGHASYWPLIYDDPDDGQQVLLVERAPRIDTDALRFLAGGEIEVTWRLRPEAMWSDGRPVTVADLQLAMEASPDDHIEEVWTVDDKTLVIRWNERLSRALEPPQLWPAHALESTVREGGFEGVREHMRDVPIPGAGPYRVVSRTEELIVIEANPHFLGAPPNIERVEIYRFADADALFEAFQRGDVDIVEPNTVGEAHLERLRQTRPEAVHQSPSSNFYFLHPDLDDPLLGRLEVRRAIALAIDREQIALQVFGDVEQIAHMPIPGDLPESTRVYDYDPDAARQILEGLGVEDTTISLTHAADVHPLMIEGIVEGLQGLGFIVEVEQVRSTWRLWRDGGHEGLVLHRLRGDADTSPRQWWNLPLVDGRYPSDARNPAYTDEIHELVEREMRALYPERREQLREALFAAWSERLPGIPMVFSDERILVDPALRNWQRPPASPFGRGMEKWYFDDSL